MSLTRIYALLLRYLYLYPRSIPRILDIVFWPIVDLLIWGWLTLYLQQSRAGIPGIVSALLGAMVFWNFIQRSQQAVSIAFLEEGFIVSATAMTPASLPSTESRLNVLPSLASLSTTFLPTWVSILLFCNNFSLPEKRTASQ